MMSVAPVEIERAREAMQSPGGFVWWYVDAVDEQGNGVVVIWSYGLPFLPGYLESCRRGDPPEAGERPSLNVSVYRDGELDCYLLQEYDPEQVDWSPAERRWEFGRSTIRAADGGESARVDMQLDCAVPGTDERLVGAVEVEGPTPEISAAHGPEAGHRWQPRIVCGAAEVDLRVGETIRYRSQGRAYHDINCGTRSFDRLGIEQWIWGRVPMEDREVVYFGLWPGDQEAPEHIVLEFREDGDWSISDDVDLELATPRWNLGAMKWWRRLELLGPPSAVWSPMRVEAESVVDSGPFYMRYLTETTVDGRTAHGVGELIRPPRVDLARHRPFVRMRVQEMDERNSAWLPLFTGPKRGRLKRLFNYNFGSGG